MQYGYEVSEPRNSDIRALTLEGMGDMSVDKWTVVNARERCIMVIMQMQRVLKNVAREVHYGYKVWEPGTYITLGIVI